MEIETDPHKSCKIIFAIILTTLPNIGCWILSLLVKKYALDWIKTLKIPKWAPPKWSELPVWTLVYCGIGYASYLVYHDGHGFRGCSRIPLILYIIQLTLNWGFIPLFFACHKLKCSFYHMLLLDLAATFCGISFYFINPIAGLLFIPYVLWHIYYTAVTYVIYRDNYQNDIKRFQNETFMKPELIINSKLHK